MMNAPDVVPDIEAALVSGCDGCEACPFSCSEAAEQGQNLACLPTRQEILQLVEAKQRPWGCHEDETKVCRGYASVAVQVGMPVKGTPISYAQWYRNEADV